MWIECWATVYFRNGKLAIRIFGFRCNAKVECAGCTIKHFCRYGCSETEGKNVVTFYNDGNVPSTFYLSIPFVTNVDGTNLSRWDDGPRIVEANSTDELTSVDLPVGGSTNFRIMVRADASLGTSNWIGFTLMASNAEAVLADATNYTGDNSLLYGGDMGEATNGLISAPYYGKVYQQTNVLVELFIGLVDPYINKLVVSPISLASNPQPGEYVRYKIEYANNGISPISGSRITDLIPANTTYSRDSLYHKEGANPLIQLTDDADDDAGYFDGTQLVFCVDGGIAPNTSGTIGALSGGELYFTVMVNTNGFYLGQNIVFITNKDNSFDGIVNESLVATLNSNLQAGDEDSNDEVRALTGFDLSSIPDSADILNADLFLKGYHVEGQATDITPIWIDHLDYGPTIEGSDYIIEAIESEYMSFAVPSSGWEIIDSLPQVQDAHTNDKVWSKGVDGSRKWFQIRLRPGQINTNNNSADQQWVYSADQGTNYPYLRVRYSSNAYVPAPHSITNQVCLEGANILSTSTNIGTKVFYPADFQINKDIKSITLNGADTNAMPGSTILYSIEFTNTGDFPGLNGVVYDDIPVGLKYESWSLLRTNSAGDATNWTPEYSFVGSPNQSYTSPNYSPIEPPFNVRWVRIKNDILPAGIEESGLMTYMSFEATVGYLAAGSYIDNLSVIEGSNFTRRESANSIVIATQYGGSFNFLSDIAGTVGTNYFLCSLANRGNIDTTFSLSIPYTQQIMGNFGVDWEIKIVGASDTTEISNVTLPMGGVANFRVMIAVSNTVTNDAWIDFRLLADTGTAEVRYTGDDGVQYGGDIGLDYNGALTIAGKFYQQVNTNIRLTVSDPANIRIIKTKVSPATPYLGGPVRYQIY